MIRVSLLKLDEPTETTGRIYSKRSALQWLEHNGRSGVVYGELGQPDVSSCDPPQAPQVDLTNVCVMFTDFKIENGCITAKLTPTGPHAGSLTAIYQDGTAVDFRMRGFVRAHMKDDELIHDIVDIVAFDAVYSVRRILK